uniref:FLYWCH-type domain-containing protein n=1 Tax=Angiostrongylus cantonensis TaxID=6313 RepID=A0A0K0D3D6_ANGCA
MSVVASFYRDEFLHSIFLLWLALRILTLAVFRPLNSVCIAKLTNANIEKSEILLGLHFIDVREISIWFLLICLLKSTEKNTCYMQEGKPAERNVKICTICEENHASERMKIVCYQNNLVYDGFKRPYVIHVRDGHKSRGCFFFISGITESYFNNVPVFGEWVMRATTPKKHKCPYTFAHENMSLVAPKELLRHIIRYPRKELRRLVVLL